MFIISKHSLESNVCHGEIDYALKNNKRIIPIVVDDLSPEVVNKFIPDLNKINWIIFENNNHFEITESTPDASSEGIKVVARDPQFKQAMGKLNETIHKDWDWVKYHTQLQNDAIRWQKNSQNPSYQLRGAALKEAEKRVLITPSTGPEVTDLQIEYIHACQKGAQKRKRTLTVSILTGTVLLLILGMIGISEMLISNFRKLLSESNSAASTNPGLSLLLAVEAQNSANIPGTREHREDYNYEARNNLLNVLEGNPNLITYLPQDSSYVIGVSYRFDGKVLATSNANGEIRLWNITDPKNPAQIGDAINIGVTVPDVLFSPDGKTLYSSDFNGSIRIWDVSNPNTPRQVNLLYSGDIKEIYSLALSPDGTFIAAAGDTGTVDIWDVSDPSKKDISSVPLKSFTSDVMGLAFSPDGKILAVSSFDKAIDLWSISDPVAPIKLKSISTGDKDPYAVAFSPEGTTLAIGLGDGAIAFYNIIDPTTASLRLTVSGQNNSIYSLAFNPSGTLLASANTDHSIKVWNMEDSQNITEADFSLNGHTGQVNRVAFNPDGTMLASTGGDKETILWNISSTVDSPLIGSVLGNSLGAVKNVAYNNDGSLLASGSVDVNLWSMDEERQYKLASTISTLDLANVSTITTFAFDPSGKILALAVNDSTNSQKQNIELFDVSKPNQPVQLAEVSTPHSDKIWTMVFTHDGKTLISGSFDRSVHFWDVSNPSTLIETGKAIESLSADVYSLAVSQPKNLLAIGTSDGHLYFYDISSLDDPNEIGDPQITSGTLLNLAFSSDGKLLASGSNDSATLWNTTHPFWSIYIYSKIVNSSLNGNVVVALSPDGKTLVTGGKDSSLDLWDISDPTAPRQLGNPLTNQGARIWSLAYNPDGSTIVSGYEDYSTVVWNIGTQSLIEKACQITNRNLTEKEWILYVGIQPYRQICSLKSKTPISTDLQLSSSSETYSSSPELSFGSVEDALNASTDQYIESMAAGQHTQKEMSQVGKTLTYTINLKSNQPLVWTPRWCASDEAKLDENLKQLDFAFYLNDEPIDESHIFAQKEVYYDMACQTYYAYLFNWPKSTTYLKYVVTIKEPLEDGTYNYPAGEQTFIFKINN
jgi:WD40 repeat protein